MRTREFSGQVVNGKLPEGVAKAIGDLVRQCDGKTLVLRISIRHRLRSLKQNRFYFGVVVPLTVDLFRDAGDPVDEDSVHDYLMKEVGGFGFRSKLTGRMTRRSSTTLTTAEWENYLEQIRAWGAEYGCMIPFPREAISAPAAPCPARSPLLS